MVASIPYPTNVTSATKSLNASMNRIRCEASDMPELSFEMLIPSDMHSSVVHRHSAACFQPLARFVSETSDRRIEVSHCRMQREAAPADWLAAAMSTDDCQILTRRSLARKGGSEVDLLTKRLRDGKPTLCRTLTRKNGADLFRLDAIVPENDYREVANAMFVSLASYRTLDKAEAKCAEELTSHSIGNACLGFQIPRSWGVAESGSNHMVLRNHDDATPVGKIEVRLFDKSSNCTPTTTIQDFARELKQQGVILGGAPIAPLPTQPALRRAMLFVPRGTFNGVTLATPVVAGETERQVVRLSLVGPSEDVSPAWWAVNKRAFEIVRQTLSAN